MTSQNLTYDGDSETNKSDMYASRCTSDGVIILEAQFKTYPQHITVLQPGLQFQHRNNIFNLPTLPSLLTLPQEATSVVVCPRDMEQTTNPFSRLTKEFLLFTYIIDFVVDKNMYNTNIDKYQLKDTLSFGKSKGPIIAIKTDIFTQDTQQPLLSGILWTTTVDRTTRSATALPAWWVRAQDPIGAEVPQLSRLNLELPKNAFCRQQRVTFTCIDGNHHLTTKAYGEFCMDTIYDAIMEGQLGSVTLSDLTYCRRIKAQFFAECKMGDQLDVYVWREDTPPRGFDSPDSIFIGCTMKKAERVLAMLISFQKSLDNQWFSLSPGTSTLS